jgi:hypothetical protein
MAKTEKKSERERDLEDSLRDQEGSKILSSPSKPEALSSNHSNT